MRNHVTQKGHKWKKKEQMASVDRITHLNYIIKNSYWAQNYIYIREIRIKSVFSFVIIFFYFSSSIVGVSYVNIKKSSYFNFKER